MVGLLFVIFGSGKVATSLLQPTFIDSLYGTGAFAHGLRLVGKHGQLSDGRQMPADMHFFFSVCWVILSVLPPLVYMAVLYAFELFPPDRLFEKADAKKNIAPANPRTPPWLVHRLSSLKRRHSNEPKEDWKKTWKP
jgi:hypothetical protein